jgi:hypothetical protein
MIDNPTIVIKTIDATITLNKMTRTQRVPSPTTKRMIADAITSRKRAMRPCIMTSPLCQAPAICQEEGVKLIPDLLHILGLALTQAAGARTTTMWPTITGRIHPSSAGTCMPPRVTMVDAFITLIRAILSFPPSPPQV